MRTYRTFHPGELVVDGHVDLERGEGEHLRRVLRCPGGTHVEVVNGAGALARGVLDYLTSRDARVYIEQVDHAPAPARQTELALAITRPASFEEALHHAVELGATRIIPVLTERTVVALEGERAERRLERWVRIAQEALKQCERLWIPEIEGPASLEEALDGLAGRGVTPVVLQERVAGVGSLLAAIAAAGDARAFLVGPEGGWGPGDQELFARPGVLKASLGSGILRSETAALAALAVALGMETDGNAG